MKITGDQMHHHIGEALRIRREAGTQGVHIGQSSSLAFYIQNLGQLPLAALVMSHGRKIDGNPAGLAFRQLLKQRLECPAVGFTREQLIAILE